VVKPSKDWEFAETYFQQGNECHEAGQLEEAIAAYRKCLELQPSYLPARYNLGVTLGDMENYSQAAEELKKVVEAEARHSDAYNSLGFVFSKQRLLNSAIENYEKAIQIQPDFAKAHHNLGMTLLQLGQLDRGWQECEWRWQTPQFTAFNAPHPRWYGEEIKDKTLLLHTEQGAGDAIQFIRYIPLIAQRCKKLILVCPAGLISIFQDLPGIDEIRTAGEISISSFDTYAALMSLPAILKTTLTNIPDQVPYLSVPSASNHFEDIRQTPGPKIGLVWAGSTTHSNDGNRSATVQDFGPIIQNNPNFNFYSLQVGDRVGEVQQFPSGSAIIDLSDRLTDYGATANAINHLDLVITVDTSVAHLAGALGKPVWNLLCYNPDWRWLLDRADSPWYPTMKLFRQPKPKDWSSVMIEVQTELMRLKL
jgi:hypothetical protein